MNRLCTGSLAVALGVTLALGGCGGGSGGGDSGQTSRKWGTATLIEHSEKHAESSRVAFAGDKHAFAVWTQDDGTRIRVFASHYVVGTGWQAPQIIDSDAAGYSEAPQIAAAGRGDAVVVWRQYDGTHFNIMANHYTADTGWGTAVAIEGANDECFAPQVAIGPAGNASAIWLQGTNVVANRYTPGVGWGDAAVIETGAGVAEDPQIAMDPSGNALALWRQPDGGNQSIWSNLYTAGWGWGSARVIETGDNGNAANARLAFGDNGHAVAVWVQSDGTHANVYANHYLPGAGWSGAVVVENDDTITPSEAQIAADAEGNALVVWQAGSGVGAAVWSNRYSARSGWGAAAKVADSATGGVTAPRVAMDASGNAMALWIRAEGVKEVLEASRYIPSTGWEAPQAIEADDSYLDATQIAVAPGGSAVAVWGSSDGLVGSVVANHFE